MSAPVAERPATHPCRLDTEPRESYNVSMVKKPTAWQRFWARWRRPLIAVLLVGTVLAVVFGAYGVAALLFVIVLGLGAFGGGGPTENGRTSPPSVPGTIGMR